MYASVDASFSPISRPNGIKPCIQTNIIVYTLRNSDVMYSVGGRSDRLYVAYSLFSSSPFSFCARSYSMICLLQLDSVS